MSDPDIEAELEALRAEYRADLRPRLEGLETLRRALAAGEPPATGMRELYRGLHSIAGSAKTFGLPEVSEAARAAERYLEPHCAAGAPLPDWDELRRLLDALGALTGRT